MINKRIFNPYFLEKIQSPSFRAKIKTSYVINIVITFLLGLIMILDFAQNQYQKGFVNLIVLLILITSLFLFIKAKFVSARIVLIVITSLACFSSFFTLGRSNDIPYIFMGPIALAYLIHSKEEFKSVIIVSIISYVLMFVGFFIVGDNFKTVINPPLSAFITAVILVFSFNLIIHFLKKDERIAFKEWELKTDALTGFQEAISKTYPTAIFNYEGGLLEENNLFKELFNPKGVSDLNILLKNINCSCTFEQVIQKTDEGNYWKGEISILQNNETLWFQGTVTPINENLLLVLNNVTKTKSKEIEVVKLKGEKDLAEKESQFKDNFLSNMSHEIRTPLNGIIGVLDMISLSDLNKEQKDLLEIVNSSSHVLLDIINDILEISKIQAGKVEINNKSFNLRDIAKLSENLYKGLVNKNGVTLKVLIDNDLPNYIVSDQTRVFQVVNNLLSNAIKFTNKGEVTLNIKKDKSLIRFEVIDDGIGISEEGQKKLFKKFFQEKNEKQNTTIKGTGLGLAICKELVTLLGGDIGVFSKEGEGTKFWFHIPLVIGEELKKHTGFKEVAERKGKNVKVLLVEDNHTNQIVASLVLKKLNCDVVIANNGKEAIDKANDSFDLILMDIQMPIMGGVEAMQSIKSSGLKTPIVALSANAMEGDKEIYLAKGFDNYIPKPIRINVIEKLIYM